MRTIFRRKLVLPVLLAAIAAIVGGLFAGLGGPDPVGETQAHGGSAATHTYAFHFMPPTGSNNTTQQLTCGWHAICANGYSINPGPDKQWGTSDDIKDGLNDLRQYGHDHGLDFDIAGEDGFEPHTGTTVYMRGYGYTLEPGHTIRRQPFTTRIFSWPRGKAGSFTSCYAVEVPVYGNNADERADRNSFGRYRIYHLETTREGDTYKPYFSSDGSPNLFTLGTAVAGSREASSCPSSGTHAHVSRDKGNNPNWMENRKRYPTESETWNKAATPVNNLEEQNWTHRLCLAETCSPSSIEVTPLIPATGGRQATATGTGSSTETQEKAGEAAKAAALAELIKTYPTAKGRPVAYTVTDLPSVSMTKNVGPETGSGSGSTREAAIAAAKTNAAAKLPSGTSDITYGTATVTGGKRTEYSHTFSVSGTSSTRAGARSAALVNWRNTADNLSNLVRLGTRGVTTVRQTSTSQWQATATGSVVRWRLVNDTRVEYTDTVTVQSTASTKAAARQAALIRWRNVADNLPNFVRLGTRGIAQVRQISTDRWEARVSGTVILYRISPYSASITATGKHTTTTFHASAVVVTVDPANKAPTASATRTPATVAGGGKVTLNGTASDPDGDTLTYAWSSNGGGSFANPSAVDTTWTAPAGKATAQTITLTLVVTDSRGGRDTARVTVTVSKTSNTVPAAPAAPTIGTPAAAYLPVSWTAPASGSAITGYDLQHREGTTGSWTETDVGLVTSYSLSGLTAATDYQVQVRARNTHGDGPWSPTATGTTAAAPANPCVSELGTLTTTITRSGIWEEGCDSTRRDDRYARFFTFALAARTEVTIDLESTDTPKDDPYLILLTGAGREGRLVTLNDDGGDGRDSRIVRTLDAGSYTAEATTFYEATGGFTITVAPKQTTVTPTPTPTPVPTTAPAAPAAPSIGTPTTTTLPVSWSAPSNGGSAITGYDLRHRTGGGSWTETDVGNVTSRTLTGLSAGTTYDLQVRARNSVGDGDWSPTGTGTTSAVTQANRAPSASASGDPTTVDGGGSVSLDGTASDPDGDTLTYSWTSDGGGSFISASALDTTWTAPAATSSAQAVTLTLTVTDPKGLTASATVAVTVSAAATTVSTACSTDLGALTAEVTRSGSWTASCTGSNPYRRDTAPNGQFFTFSLAQRTSVAVEVELGDRHFHSLFIRQGQATEGERLHTYITRLNPVKRTYTLNAGTYTLELNTFRYRIGDFTLTLTPGS